jgi:hypothetical protein
LEKFPELLAEVRVEDPDVDLIARTVIQLHQSNEDRMCTA